VGRKARTPVPPSGRAVTTQAPPSAAARSRIERSPTPAGGAVTIPAPGDPDASGSASLTLNQGQGEVCFELSWAGIDGTVVAAHVHAAPVGVAGPVVVPLFTGVALQGTDSASGCVSGMSEELVKAIRHDPASYYVNVRSTVFPAGRPAGSSAGRRPVGGVKARGLARAWVVVRRLCRSAVPPPNVAGRRGHLGARGDHCVQHRDC
jgi:CHRD domain